MSEYRLPPFGDGIVRVSDGACIPVDEHNADWRTYQDWLADGHEPDPYEAPPLDLTAYTMTQRDALIDGGVTFEGVVYQSRPSDRENVAGAALLAFMATVAGAQPGDLRWHGGDSDFVWIALDNSLVTMDAPTVIEFGKTFAAAKQRFTLGARAIKDAIADGIITTTEQVDAAFAAL